MAINPNTPVLGGVSGAVNNFLNDPVLSPVSAARGRNMKAYYGNLNANQQANQQAVNAFRGVSPAAFNASIEPKIGKRSGGGRRARVRTAGARIRKPRVKGMGRRSRSTRRRT